MRASALISIRPVLEQAIDTINVSFEREKQSRENAAEFEKKYDRLVALSEDHKPMIKSEQSEAKQSKRGAVSSPRIEGFYPWRHRVVLAANSLAECGWTIEAGAIHEELNKLPKHQIDWTQPGASDDLRDEIRKVGSTILDILTCCAKSKSDDSEQNVALKDDLYRNKALLIWGGERFEWLTETMMDALELMVERYPEHVLPDEMAHKLGRLPEGGFKKIFKTRRGGKSSLHPVVKVVGGRSPRGWFLIK